MSNTQPDGYLARPAGGTGRPVLVLHAWWGLNDNFKEICTRLAEAGFVAFAPDLYQGKVVDTPAEAEQMVAVLNAREEEALAAIDAATRFLVEQTGTSDQGVTVMGFSLGAYYALDLSIRDPEHIRSVVLFYGTGPDDFTSAQATYLGHFAEQDEFEPEESVAALENALKKAGRPATFYRYPGTGHWFFESDRPDAYNEAAATLAWDRTLAFLRRSST